MSSKPTRPCCEASFMVKFLGKRDHAEKFLSGAMLARRLKYFKDLEDDPARSDPNDGLRAYRHISSEPAPASKHFTHVGTVSTGAQGAPRIRAMEISYTTDENPYVICLSRFVSDNQDPATFADDWHDALFESGYRSHDLEQFPVRIVFCLFADDTGISARSCEGGRWQEVHLQVRGARGLKVALKQRQQIRSTTRIIEVPEHSYRDIGSEPRDRIRGLFGGDGLRPGFVDDDAGEFHVSRLQHADRGQGMAERAQIAAGDQQRRRAERRDPVQHRVPAVQGDHDPADALDERHVGAAVRLAEGHEFVEGNARVRPRGGHVRGQRFREPPRRDGSDGVVRGRYAEGLQQQRAVAVGHRLRAYPGGDRLERTDAAAAAPQLVDQGAGDEGLADLGARCGDEDRTHREGMTSPTAAASRSTSSGV